MNLAREHPDPLADTLPPLVLDRQRIVHSAAFRRLQYKTQVFVALEEDHFRTRLTHTLEVANLARLLAARLGLDPDLAEVVALAHDLGHPPFGHAGERALDECTRNHGGFEHNAHSLRVVEFLEHPYPGFRGLNLTHVVRECLAKHSTRYDKPGRHPLQDGRPAPLEGEVADVADRLAYTLHDLQDGIYAGLIDRTAISELRLWRDASGSIHSSDDALWRRGLRSTVDRMQNALVADVAAESRTRLASILFAPADVQPSATADPLRSQAVPHSAAVDARCARDGSPSTRADVSFESGSAPSSSSRAAADGRPNGIAFTSHAQGAPAESQSFPSVTPVEPRLPVRSPSDTPFEHRPSGSEPCETARVDSFQRCVSPSQEMESQLQQIEQFLLANVYRHNRLARMDSKARRVIRALFDAYVAEPALMPRRFADRVSELGPHRVAADYIAGMTDRFCLREHARLFDPNTLSH